MNKHLPKAGVAAGPPINQYYTAEPIHITKNTFRVRVPSSRAHDIFTGCLGEGAITRL
jgi:hypothetical protein